MTISIDWNALPPVVGVVLTLTILQYCGRYFRSVVLPFSSLPFIDKSRNNLRQRLAPSPQYIFFLSLAFFLTAALDPQIYLKKSADQITPMNDIPPPIEGIALYFILDQSGSMEEKAQVQSTEGRVTTTKINLLKQMTKAFIGGDSKAGLLGRPNDMIGLVAFARTAQVLSPLTLDHKQLIELLDRLNIMKIKDQDGTGIGYAIYKTANLIAATRHFSENLLGQGKPAYDIKDAVMILVTDGMQDPNPLDQDNRFRWMDPEQAALFAKEQKIKLYVVNIDPEFTKPEWEANRKQMQRVAEMTGGRFYSMNTSSNIADIYKEIDSLEKSHIPAALESIEKSENQYTIYRLYPGLVAAGMALFAAALLLQTTWLRISP